MSLIFKKSNLENKKYSVFVPRELWNKKRPDKIKSDFKKIDFGAIGYPQYKDNTPLKLYSHLNHNNKDRKERYYKRHGKDAVVYSPKYFSHKFLW